VRGANWRTVFTEIAELTSNGEATGHLGEKCPDNTGQLQTQCPEASGQLQPKCPDEPGTTARTYKDKFNQLTTTSPTTPPLSGEWVKLADEMFQDWGMGGAMRAATIAHDEGWTIEAVRELRTLAWRIDTGKRYRWLGGD
jgi:hypothetical protein